MVISETTEDNKPAPRGPGRFIAVVIAVLSLPAYIALWLAYKSEIAPSAGLSSMGAAYLFVPLALCALCTGFTGIILTVYEWWRYYVRGKTGKPESALPLIALSLFNAPFFWLVLKITAYFV